ncbi:complex I subunit 1/NuoH family protein [Chrysiogenes arsenatis]|uniref:complex I subunit 1/NuoH family protein n=1 Tax=Chrysiogenes arsenatis TaxID=309797 RepID=UPI0003FEB57D|nr:NADH-quinone oxidoreductase subunit H [Chrysiogenes arsenatis]
MTWVDVLMVLLRIVFAVVVPLLFVPIFVWLERRGASYIQDRSGPNRCHIGGITLFGLIQPIADAVKLIFKEDLTPRHIKNKFYFYIAPAILFSASLLTFAVIPFADSVEIGDKSYLMQAIPTDIGILWFLGIAGIAVYGIILAGWASHNKYSILGGLRASAQVISYEVPMGLALIGILICYGTVDLNQMVRTQSELLFGFLPNWGIFLQPFGFLLFMIAAIAESNRTPFDCAEGESEIVGGYHTEYSSMKFALFFMGEYVAMFVSSALIATLYFGGYNIPYVTTEMLRENSMLVAAILMVIVPVAFLAFIFWMHRTNRSHYTTADDKRTRETKILTWAFLVVMFGIQGLLGISILAGDAASQMLTVVIQIVVFLMKTFFFGFLYVWIRWTLPRFRYDQLQNLGWKYLLPLALLNIFITGAVVVCL